MRGIAKLTGSTLAALAACLLTHVAAAGQGSAAGDWPQWRGLHRDGVSPESGLLSAWPEGGPPELWRVALSEGFSSVAISGDAAYTMFASGVDEFVLALDIESGDELWRVRVDSKFVDNQGNGPRSTPTVNGDLVYAMSARGKLYALRRSDGTIVWHHNLRKLFGSSLQGRGFASSPLVDGDLLILQVGGKDDQSIAAMNKHTGKVQWTSHSDEAGYSSPIAVTANGVKQLICLTARNLLSLDPANGAVNWEYPWGETIPIATPLLLPGNRIFVSAAYDKGAAVVRIVESGGDLSVEELWFDRGMKNWINSSVLQDGYLYGFDNSTLKCISAETGEMKWRHRGLGRGSLILADGHLIVLSEDGELVLIEATPEEYRQKGSFQAFNSKCWTEPALAGGKLFIRSESELITLDLRGPAGT